MWVLHFGQKLELAAELTSCFALHSKHSISELWCLFQNPSIFWRSEGSLAAAAASTRFSFGRIRISCFGAEGAKCEPHWRHIVLFAAAYSICLKPQCGQSTLTFAGDEFATGRLWRKVTKLEPRKRISPSPPALHFGQPPDVPEPEQERQRPCWRHR